MVPPTAAEKEKADAIAAEKAAEVAHQAELKVAEAATPTIDAELSLTGRKAITVGNTPSDAGTDVSNRTDIPAGVILKSAKQAISKHTKTRPHPEKYEKKRDTSKRAPIASLAQLKEERKLQGRAPTTEEVAQVKQLEADIMEEGGKHERLASAEAK